MHGPNILARSIEQSRILDGYGNTWQYHSQSDAHSKVGCWGVAFDLLQYSGLLRRHVADGKVVLGVNHGMKDFRNDDSKVLDLVIGRPVGSVDSRNTFKSLVERYAISLTAAELRLLDTLPDIPLGEVGSSVLVALEAKAVMTRHVSSLPRLYSELNSSHSSVHGASAQALAIAYVQINAASQFASPPSNRRPVDSGHPAKINTYKQPHSLQRTLDKVGKLPRRSGTTGTGFDGIGISVIEFENRGGPVSLITQAPAPQKGDTFNYDTMVSRMGNEYDSRFHSI